MLKQRFSYAFLIVEKQNQTFLLTHAITSLLNNLQQLPTAHGKSPLLASSAM